jgi:hypothetical protein
MRLRSKSAEGHAMQATPQSDVVSPVTPAELAVFVGVNDPLFPRLLQTATDAVVRYINHDLNEREWVAIVPAPAFDPVRVSKYPPVSNVFELPYTGLIQIISVTSNGAPVDYTVEHRRPARVTVHGWDYRSQIQIEYVAGMEIIPASIKMAIEMVAAYLYEHRGACDVDDAVIKSGAAGVLRSYRVEVSL